MQNGEHSTGGRTDTAPGTALGRTSADAEGGPIAAGAGGETTATGWLDRVALHSRSEAPATHALRPRLPYPFEAMRFATADAASRMPPPHGLRSLPEEAVAATPRAGRPDGLAAAPATDPFRPAVTAPAVTAPYVADAAPQPARQPHEAHPVAAAQPAGRVELAQANEKRAPLNRDAHAPSATLSIAAHPVAPSQPARLVSSQLVRLAPTAAGRLPAHNETPAASVPARQNDHGAAHATPRRAPAAPDGKPTPQPTGPSTASMRPAGAERSQPALRGAPPQQAPLTARPSAEAAQEITIDIHIGRIDVRAPAGAAAPTAVQAPPQRGGDALNAYLSRRARGARS